MSILNAFQIVRQKGTPTPAEEARKRAQAHITAAARAGARALDRNGRPVVPLAPRASSSLLIENAAQSKAAAHKRQALLKGSI
ncbi:hypothetical protein [Diaphorobacter sp.]|uniref:hypothetical protein n=1 Tax=Diaphorobacter sp. TaxID=1934310 RepID=UPI002588372A|nr:hypothetical protein [Diaphorobacter sp.]